MNYFSQFLRTGASQAPPKVIHDHAVEFNRSWNLIKNTLLHPDERQLSRGIHATDVPAHLQSMVDSLVWESNRTEEGATGACLEYLLKNDVLGTLVRLSEPDRPSGVQAEVLRAVQNMVVLLDEQFLVHSAVHRAILRLLRNCVGDDIQEQLDGRNKVRGAAGTAVRSQPSVYEEDLVNLLCILCSRIRTYRELLMIFFHDKHWYRSEPLFAVEEEDEDEDDDDDDDDDDIQDTKDAADARKTSRPSSPTGSQATVTSAPGSLTTKKTEYEFLLFNYLLRFVHREGQIGDFARAGLLFLMDVAMSPGEPVHRLTGDDDSSKPASSEPSSSDPITDAALALAEYILDGDFSDVLGAGLVAVYSVLPTKLEIRPSNSAAGADGTAMVLGGTFVEDEDEKERLEAARERNRALGVEDASNPDFKSRLDHFLKLLEFLQDVLRRNQVHDSPESGVEASALVGNAIVQSILDSVRRIFLENVLYPSVLECSDADGSAVAVMSYIEIMIRTLQDGQLGDLLVNFMMSEDNDEVWRPRARTQTMLMLIGGSGPPKSKSSVAIDKASKVRKRKSSAMQMLELEAPDARRQSEYPTSMGRFTLKDLLLSNLRSKNQPTATAALQLFQSMLHQHCVLSVDRLIIVTADPKATSFPQPMITAPLNEPTSPDEEDDEDGPFVYPGAEDEKLVSFPSAPEPPLEPVFSQPETTYATHEREMGLYLTLVSRVDPSHNEDAFSTGYDHYLRDALFSIQNQPCYQLEGDAEEQAKLKHRLNSNDPILSLILESLRRFFTNTPEFNIALTGVLATLAICPNRSLAGWLTFASNDAHPDPSIDRAGDAGDFEMDGDDRSIDFKIDEKLSTDTNFLPASSVDQQSRPIIHTIFHGLVAQLERYRQLVDNFDKYLLERRQGLLFSENLTDALSLALEIGNDSIMSPIKVFATSSTGYETPPRTKSKPTAASQIVSFLTPKKNKGTPAKAAAASEPSTPPRSNKKVAASPFGPHYQKTGAITVEPYVAPVPESGLWTPGKRVSWSAVDEDVFSTSGQWGDESSRRRNEEDDQQSQARADKPTTVTLSQLLDNVVVLEESIKELVAIIHARRSLGIDSIRYL